MRSCSDIYKSGARKNGNYFILGAGDVELKVFCDFESEANSTWTLVLSFELGNKLSVRLAYYSDQPRSSSTPNWKDYRSKLIYVVSFLYH